MKKYTQLTRLMRLHNLLLDVARKDFGMWRWGNKPGKQTITCGIPSCLGGWATKVIPELRLVLWEGIYDLENTKTKNRGEEAFQDAFDLSLADAESLTNSSADHQTPKQAAAAVLAVAIREAEDTDYYFPEIE